VVGFGFLGLELAFVALVLVLLNARDRRRDRATIAALRTCPVSLLSVIAVNARASLWRRRVTVTLDLTGCDDGHVWSTVRAVAAALPPRTSLIVRTRVGPVRTAAIGLRPWAPFYRSRAS
jgi:hypothetical protein